MFTSLAVSMTGAEHFAIPRTASGAMWLCYKAAPPRRQRFHPLNNSPSLTMLLRQSPRVRRHYGQRRPVQLVIVPVLLLLLLLLCSFLHYQRRHQRSKNIAFFIQAYNRTIPLLPSLLDVLWHPKNVYAIHVDNRTDPASAQAVHRLVTSSKYQRNIFVIPSQNVTYMGISLVLNTLHAISFLLRQTVHWDYFINLSAADYPLVRSNHLRQILSDPFIIQNHLSFIQTVNASRQISQSAYQSRLRHIFIDTAIYSGLRTRPQTRNHPCVYGCLHNIHTQPHPLLSDPIPMNIIKSEAWTILHRSAAQFAVNSSLSRQLVAFFSNIHCPEEFFFSTLFINHAHFRHTIVHDAFRFVLWGNLSRKSHPPAIDSGNIPDIHTLLRTRGGLFIRKRLKPDSTIKSFIDEHLLAHSGATRATIQGFFSSRSQWNRFALEQQVRVMCAARHRRGDNGTFILYNQCLDNATIHHS